MSIIVLLMKELNIINRVADASRELGETLQAETGAGVITDVLSTPNYSEIQDEFNGTKQGTIINIIVNKVDTLSLSALAGARAIVSYGVQGSNLPRYAPSIVLEDGRLGVLHNVADAKSSPKELATLTDFQQLLLAGVFVRQRESVGVSHDSGVAELGHATLIAVSSTPDTIHATTHSFAESNQFGSKVASLTTLVEGHKQRPTETIIMDPQVALQLLFRPDHQSPLPANGFEASAGFALAARKTQEQPFDLKANAGAMARQMGA